MNMRVSRDVMDLSAMFRQNASVGFFSQMTNNFAPQITVTDLAPQANFQFDKPTAVDRVDTSKAGGQAPDMSASRESAMACGARYMELNDQAIATVGAALEHTCGPEEGAQVMSQLLPSGGSSNLQAACVAVDPTGSVGVAYTAYSELSAQADRFGNQEILERLDQARSVICEAHEAQMNGERPVIPVPKELDFSDVNAQQLRDFCMRNPAEDPVMQEVQAALDTCDQIENDMQIYEAREHEVAGVDKIAAALERGDKARVAEYGESAEAVVAEMMPAAEVAMYSDTLMDISGVESPVGMPFHAVTLTQNHMNYAARYGADAPGAGQDLESEARVAAASFDNRTMPMG